jgi:hypothetical protein
MKNLADTFIFIVGINAQEVDSTCPKILLALYKPMKDRTRSIPDLPLFEATSHPGYHVLFQIQ